jgi:hypothetical protein
MCVFVRVCVYAYIHTYIHTYIYRVTDTADVGATITIATRTTGTHPLGHVSINQPSRSLVHMPIHIVGCRVRRPRASTAQKKRVREICFDTMVWGVGGRVIRPPGKMSRTNVFNCACVRTRTTTENTYIYRPRKRCHELI